MDEFVEIDLSENEIKKTDYNWTGSDIDFMIMIDWNRHIDRIIQMFYNDYQNHPDRKIIPHPLYVPGYPIPPPIPRTPEQIAKNMADLSEISKVIYNLENSRKAPEDWFIENWKNGVHSYGF